MRRALGWTLGGLALLLLLSGLMIAGGYLWLRASLPQTEGTLKLAALRAPVEVLRDDDGVVTIRAESEHDATVALGYVHAQDRLFQMDAMRRSGAGRLSEVMGDRLLPVDRFMRVLGFRQLAEANLNHLAPRTRAALQAYTEGVNAFIDTPGRVWPPEFYLLGYRPEPWRPGDSLLWGRLMAMQLSGNWQGEVVRARVAARLKPEQMAVLWPPYPEDAPVTLDAIAARLDDPTLKELARLLPWELAPKSASNVWALASSRTVTGKPLLANDPHLALTLPGTWYLVRIETPGLTLAGATAPGVPFLILGHNKNIAWGFTTTESDTQDLFVERLAAGDPSMYETPKGPQRFETRREVIRVRGGRGKALTVRQTRHGPVISDAVAGTAAEPGTVLALAWPGLREDDRTADAIYALNRAQNWNDFVAAMRHFHSPQQNVAYADRSGNIGFIAPARVPIRKAGDGSVPVPGWTNASEWIGYIPFSELPRAFNPDGGEIVNANNKVTPQHYPYLLTTDWPSPYRARRIEEMLDGLNRADLDAMRAIQLDMRSLAAIDLLPHLLEAARGENLRSRQALDLLSRWDGRMQRGRPEPLIFTAWLQQLDRMLLADELGSLFPDLRHSTVPTVIAVLTHGNGWCDDVMTPETESCSTQITTALAAALETLANRFGPDPHSWRWGQAHVARFPHTVWSQVPLIGDWLSPAVATDGGNYTVNRAGMRLAGPPDVAFENIHGPGLRAIYDLADLDNSRFMIATGQSGNPLSGNYGGFVERWRDGHYVKLVGSDKEPLRRLVLNPG